MATNDAPRYAPAAIETISPEDFETASIRSAAPSYISDAPSYHSTAPITSDPVPPPYSPRTDVSSHHRHGRPAPLIPPSPSGGGGGGGFSMVPAPTEQAPGSHPRTTGLPPVPSAPLPLPGLPSLGQFRIPTISANPNARHYHRVAHRRANAASTSHSDGILRRALLDQIEEEEQRNRVRPLEDPYLVGEQAASQARQERLARENGMDILIREDRRWDLFLAQMRDQEERERSWKRFRRAADSGRGGRLVHRLGALGAR